MNHSFMRIIMISSLALLLACNQNQVEETNTEPTQVESETVQTDLATETETSMQADYKQIANLDQVIEESQNHPVFLFKHSTACHISAAAKEVMDGFVEDQKIPVYLVVVQTDRPMSNTIAEKFDIKHESPQLLLLNKGEINHVYNHYEIRRDHIEEDLNS